MTWWQECVTGPVDLQEYTLCEKVGGRAVARTLAWVLDPFSTRWGEHAVGVLDIVVLPELRRQGLARFLLSQLLRFFQDQLFTLAEIQADANDLPTEGLLARSPGASPSSMRGCNTNEPFPESVGTEFIPFFPGHPERGWRNAVVEDGTAG